MALAVSFICRAGRESAEALMINKGNLLTVIRPRERDAAQLADALFLFFFLSSSLCVFPSLWLRCALPHFFSSFFFPSLCSHRCQRPCCAPFPLPFLYTFFSPPSLSLSLPPLPFPQQLCSGFSISRLHTAGVLTSVSAAASYVAH